jgi:hypothetical protein
MVAFFDDSGVPIIMFTKRGKHLWRPDLERSHRKLKFLIFYDDLTEDAKKRLCETFNTTMDKENWGMIPLVVLEKPI